MKLLTKFDFFGKSTHISPMKITFSDVSKQAQDTLSRLKSTAAHGLEGARGGIAHAMDSAHDFAVRNAPKVTETAEKIAAKAAKAHKDHGHIIEGASAGAATGLKLSILFPPAAPVLIKGGAVVGAIIGGVAGPEISKRAKNLMDKHGEDASAIPPQTPKEDPAP